MQKVIWVLLMRKVGALRAMQRKPQRGIAKLQIKVIFWRNAISVRCMPMVRVCHKIMLKLTSGLIFPQFKAIQMHKPVEIALLNK